MIRTSIIFNKANLLLSFLLIIPFICNSQSFELYGLFNDRIVKIDHMNAKSSSFVSLKPLPTGTLKNISFHEEANCFFSIKDQTNLPWLIKIDLDGSYSEVGPLKYNGNHIKLVEGLAYDSKEKKLLISASLDGGTNDGDYHSEALLEVDITSAICRLIGLFKMENSPDADNLFVDQGIIYAVDGNPPSLNLTKLYKYSNGIDSAPVKLFETLYMPTIDGTIMDDKIFFLENRNLRSFDLSSRTLKLVGQTHNSIEFNGQLMVGLTKKANCQLVDYSLPDNMIVCDSSSITLSVKHGANYLWSTGSTNNEIIVNQSGIYWVEVTGECNSITDSIKVEFLKTPDIDIGYDIILCDDQVHIINIPADSPENKWILLWNDGTTSSTKFINKAGTYTVTAINECGSKTNEIQVKHSYTPTTLVGSDTIICPGNFTLSINEPDNHYYWQDDSQDTIFIVNRSGTYKLTIVNECGKAEVEFAITVLDFDNVLIPNIFTPNGDNINDYFELDESLVNSKLTIYNRWGRLIYEFDNYINNWDGGNLPPGTYFYTIRDVCSNLYKGWIHLIR
jgi:gliding motility-associated-like protein